MTIQILLATTNQDDYNILKGINLQSDIIVCNQNAKYFSYSSFTYNGFNVEWLNFTERGVGLNRNNALMRSTADICVIADDDVQYDDSAISQITQAFKDNPRADVILFNVHPNEAYNPYIIKKKIKISRFNCGKYGGVRIAFRRTKIIKNAITFNLLFGGGAKYSAGEDNMFIRDCIKKGLNVIGVPIFILSLKQDRESSWFKGYNKKFFVDLGASYVVHYGKFAFFCAFLQLMRHRSLWLKDYSFSEALKNVSEGIKGFKCL